MLISTINAPRFILFNVFGSGISSKSDIIIKSDSVKFSIEFMPREIAFL